MQKRLLSILLSILLLVSLTPAAEAEVELDSGSCGTDVTWTLDTSGVLTISGTGDIDDYILYDPNSLKYPPWDEWWNFIKSVVIEDGVTSVSDWAFFNLSSLTKVSIPDTVTKIGEGTFNKCVNLKDITIPDTVTEIGKSAFKGCSALSGITIPDRITYIDESTFSGCASLASIEIPETVQRIGKAAFLGCTSLKSLYIPAEVYFLGDGAFGMCSSLEDIVVDSKNTSLCSENKALYLKDTDESKLVVYWISADCSGEYTIPGGVRRIGEYAFAGSNVSSVHIPESVYFLGAYAFKDCGSLKSIFVPGSIVTMGPEAFSNCAALTDVAFGRQPDGENLYISLLAFNDCTSLTNVVFSETIKEINSYAFYNCSNLSNIYYYGNETRFNSISVGEANNNLENADVHFLTNGANMVIFDGTGGRVSYSLKTVNNGGTYGELPGAVWSGHTFDGWYTENTGGEKITESSSVHLSGTQKVYARWSAGADVHEVTFEPGAGSVSPASKSVTNGEMYGELPIPVRDDYSFDGWYTAPGSFTYGEDMSSIAVAGEKISESTTVDLQEDQILYAHWTQNISPAELEDLTYSFENSLAGFEYEPAYKIPLDRYETIFGEDSDFAKKTYDSVKSWFGNCYGISTTTCMMFQKDNPINAGAFHAGAELPVQLGVHDYSGTMDMELREFIETMQISQYSPSISRIRNANQNQIAKLCSNVRYFQSTGMNSVIISIRGSSKKGTGGHALVAYKLENAGGTEDRLFVYDSNYPNDPDCYISLKKDGAGNYTDEWYYEPLDWGSSQIKGNISYYPYSYFYNVWENRGTISNSMEETDKYAQSMIKMENMELLTINTKEASVYDMSNSLVATIRNGELRTFKKGIYQFEDVGLIADGALGDAGVAIWMPVGDYMVVNEDSKVSSFEAAMAHNKQSATVTTDAARILFHVNDTELLNSVQIDEEEKSFDIRLSSTLPGAKSDVNVNGTTGRGLFTVMQLNGSVRLGGIATGGVINVTIDGKAVPASTLSGYIPSFGRDDSRDAVNLTTTMFTDVSPNAYYCDAVIWAYENGVTAGKTENTFGPYDDCTRGQVVSFLWRAMGQPEPASSTNPFTDIKESDYYYKAVLWAVENDIASGTGSAEFSPNQTCSYAHIVTFIYRMVGETNKTGAGSWWNDAANWARNKGLLENTDFVSGHACPRGDVVTYLYRILND